MQRSDESTDLPRPSRSARRREALDVLALARQLAALPPARVGQLAMPDAVREELAELQRTPSHIAHKRELGHLARLMRAHGEDAFAAVRAAIANDRAAGAREAAELHRIEALRDRLRDADGDAALTEFIRTHPGCDHQRLRALIRRARRERDAGAPPHAQRELFRLLRSVQQAPASGPGASA